MKRLHNILKITLLILLFLCTINRTNAYSSELNLLNNTAIKGHRNMLYNREVFLTFDDGPSPNNTRKILKILDDNNVRATFFVVGSKVDENPSLLKELDNQGMAIGIHTYSHNYKKIYNNLESYLDDYERCKNSIEKLIHKTPISYVRMPGGSDNITSEKSVLDSIKTTLNNKNINYVDWNVCSNDADSKEVPTIKIENTIEYQCKNKKTAVILMHDTYYKHSTVESLPKIISYLKENGFIFRTFDDLTEQEETRMAASGIMNRR
ncbi:polysaccharide deacetylase family protein [Clostridium pasteurianum]|uniref:Putative xylanase/chitin deacetylase n=1 Tax=Clostridium pasteurianum BC1 TaxID=86416 RepID=R4K3L8_CLOPA|nr:polysaccharide deacetylase family protein [Clostridium pasteurianum]AGK97173.1 putative xylanase/chitin deacetylase [Clostridium pasteurianum BC1]